MGEFSLVHGDDKDDGRNLHVLMFPWLAHGHIGPYVELCNRLVAHGGIRVSFLSTPLNIAKTRPLGSQNPTAGVRTAHGRRAAIANREHCGASNTSLAAFRQSGGRTREVIRTPLCNIRPDCVVFDFVQWWTPRAAARLGIPTVFFQTFGAAFASYAVHPVRRASREIMAKDLTKPPPGFPSPSISWKPFEAQKEVVIHCNRAQELGGISYMERTLRCYEGCSATAIKTCDEIEGSFVQYLQDVIGRPVFPLGPLLPVAASLQTESACLSWLAKQAPSTVVYVSFGRQIFLSREEIREIALGLELSTRPFLWALRLPCKRGPVTDFLPRGFEERTSSRGLVVAEWAPQLEILSHPSTGAFMTHCGWNSLMEGMSCGLPFIALPIQSDQFLNARLICQELQVGVEVGRGEHGLLTSEEIMKAVVTVTGEEGETHVRAKAREMGEMFKSKIVDGIGSQESFINRFIKYLRLVSTSSYRECCSELKPEPMSS